MQNKEQAKENIPEMQETANQEIYVSTEKPYKAQVERKDGKVVVSAEKSEVQEENIPKGRSDKVITLITWIFRILAGSTFIFSGLVKAIDPWGSIYKIHDYIAAMPESMATWALPIITPGTFALFTVELLIGVAVITGSYRRLAAVCLTIIMLIMTPLTLWIAVSDPVPDCGCFGDALVLTNQQTFWKNVALLIIAVWLVIYNKRARCLILPAIQWLMVVATMAFALFVGFIGYSVQPPLDFRPYPTGSSLIETATAKDDEAIEKLQAVWRNGETEITIPADSIPEGEGWEFIERIESAPAVVNDKGKSVKTKGLAIYDGAEDMTEDIIPAEGEVVVVFMYDLPNLSKGNYYKLNSLDAYCKENDITMVVVASATPLQVQDFITDSLAEYPIYTAEDTAMKEVARGNPAFIYLKDGKIVYKSTFSAIPTYDFLQDTPDKPGALLMYTPGWADKGTLQIACIIFASFLILLILAGYMPRVVTYTGKRIKKSRWVKAGDVVKVLVIVSCLSLCSCSEDEPDKPVVEDERTVLIYMVATNTLHSDSQDDIDELLKGYSEYIDEVNTNILVYRTIYGSSPTLSEVVESKLGKAELKVLKTYDESVSSSSKYRMGEVINDMQRYAPAPDYGLFLWSHSTAWIPDGVPANSLRTKSAPMYYSFGDDYGKTMRITDLANAIPRNLFSFIWFDSCLMANIEVVYQLRNHCPTIVAYPGEILAAGAPYDLIFPYIATPSFSLQKAAAQVYNYYSENVSSSKRRCAVTIVRTAFLPNVATAARRIHQLGYKLQGTVGLDYYSKKYGVYFYDFKQVFTALAGSDTQAINALGTALNDAVEMHEATDIQPGGYTIDPARCCGLSCYLLGQSDNVDYNDYYKTLDWYKAVYQ